jgi:hypothetical protein
LTPFWIFFTIDHDSNKHQAILAFNSILQGGEWSGMEIVATLAPFHKIFPSILSKIHELYRIINDLSEPTKKFTLALQGLGFDSVSVNGATQNKALMRFNYKQCKSLLKTKFVRHVVNEFFN